MSGKTSSVRRAEAQPADLHCDYAGAVHQMHDQLEGIDIGTCYQAGSEHGFDACALARLKRQLLPINTFKNACAAYPGFSCTFDPVRGGTCCPSGQTGWRGECLAECDACTKRSASWPGCEGCDAKECEDCVVVAAYANTWMGTKITRQCRKESGGHPLYKCTEGTCCRIGYTCCADTHFCCDPGWRCNPSGGCVG